MYKTVRNLAVAATSAMALVGAAQAAEVTITVENLSPADGLFLTPFFFEFHDDDADSFDLGASANGYVEDVAETGSPASSLTAAGARGNTATVVTGPEGFGSMSPQPPVLDPGETGTTTLTLDETSDRWVNFLAMVIPSNDFFVGNDNPTAYEVFDADGNFTGLTFDVFSSQVWDAGTEADNNQGAAFNAAGGTATDTTDPIATADLSVLFGQSTAAGTTINGDSIGEVLARVTFTLADEPAPVPLPAGLPLLALALGGLGIAARRKRA